MTREPTVPGPSAELEDLRARLAEAEEVLRALHHGAADALVIDTGAGDEIRFLGDAQAIYRWFTDAVREGVATLSADGDIVSCDACLARTLGLPVARLLGAPMADHMAPEDREVLSAVLALPEAETGRRKVHLVTDAGGSVPAYVSTFILRGVDEQQVRCVMFTDLEELVSAEKDMRDSEERLLALNAELEARVSDRTERLRVANDRLSRVNADLLESNVELAAATEAKSAFLANMSHELRTPLNSIIGFSTVMLQGLAGQLGPEQDRQLRMVNESGKNLLALVDDLLDLARIEAGRNAAVFEDVEVPGLVNAVVTTVRPLADAKDLELTADHAPGTDLLRSDPRMLRQILTNLLGNAVKFTESGVVSLNVSVENGHMAFKVADTGHGIRAEDLPRIMEDFYQARPTEEAKMAGTGLGLAISSRLAKAIGATLDVTSEFGVGSTFTLRVPCAIDPAA
jgi:signal transduction histidine kinase